MERSKWLEKRKNYIGASDAPVIMNGHHFDKTPFLLWKEKIGIGDPDRDTSAMKYGREMEETARKAYEKYTGNLMMPEVVYHSTHSFMMATLDGLDLHGELPLEIKCPGEQDHEIAKKGMVPSKYIAQLQHQLACINKNLLHYFSYRNGEGILVEVERDETYISSLYDKERVFWKHVMDLAPPPLGDHDVRSMESDEAWREAALKWEKVTAQLAQLTQEEKECRDHLIKLAGSGFAVGCGVKASYGVRKGAIDYKKIPELAGVDLEAYRKKPVSYWRVTTSK